MAARRRSPAPPLPYAAGVPVSAAPAQLDTTTTDAKGNFSLQYTCPSTEALLYVIASGGNPGGGVNTAVKLMAAVGPCGAAPASIVVNELTTVAAVYALNGFSYVSPASGTPGSLGGCVDCTPPAASSDMTQLHGNAPAIGNAFSTAALLTDITTGLPASTLPPPAAPSIP